MMPKVTYKAWMLLTNTLIMTPAEPIRVPMMHTGRAPSRFIK